MVLSQFISYIKDLGFDVIALSQDNLIKEDLAMALIWAWELDKWNILLEDIKK